MRKKNKQTKTLVKSISESFQTLGGFCVLDVGCRKHMDWAPHPYSRATALRPAQSTTCQLSQWARSSQCDEGSVNEAQSWSMGFRDSQWEEELLGQSIGYEFSE